MKFKKIYVELSDICGLKCNFCPSKKGERGIMGVENFAKLAAQICEKSEIFTFHLLGDPLLLGDLEEYLKIAKNYKMKLEITTSGFYLSPKNRKLLLKYDNICQINISLMAFLSQSKLSLEEYFKPIIDLCNEHLGQKILSFINLRLWNLNENFKAPNENLQIYDFLEQNFQSKINQNLSKNRLARHIILNQNKLFKWPSLKDRAQFLEGKCHALKEQIGILSNGTLVPCCLDTKGDINLGNIFENSFDELLKGARINSIKEAFYHNKRIEELCKRCKFHKTRLMPN
ncbi:SPASM domain-containing protein [Campylobacter sp. CCS1377]|uniref:SPASM domain-containing protein n=1 Tax=Campylobacter sp. CCS1377 TaxID=3158229 RepID=A0AAU7E7K9_9BACT